MRAFVGLYRAAGLERPERAIARLTAALEGGEGIHAAADGPLGLAWTGGPVDGTPQGRLPDCLIDGGVYDGLDEGPGGPEPALAAAFARSGEPLLSGLRGEFGAVVRRGADVVLLRDHFGVRSIVWHQASGTVVFATELRYLVRALERRPGPDATALAHWLAFSSPPADGTLYEQVHRLRGGEALWLGSGAPTVRSYWEPRYEPPLREEPEELVERLRAGLARAVQRRCEPDGRTAVMLSGGLDSGTVAAFMSQESCCAPVNGYSAVFPRHPTADEAELLDVLDRALDLSSTRIAVQSGSVLLGALEYLEHWEVPPVSPNLFFWIPLLRRASSDGVAALLDGEGGDEMFGAPIQLISDRVARGRLLSAVALIRRLPGAGPELPWRSLRRWFIDYGFKGAVPPVFHDAVRQVRGATTYAPEYFREETARRWFETDETHDWKRLSGPGWWNRLAHLWTRGMGPTQGFDHMRRRAALAGLEARHPLIDVDLAELALRIPPELVFEPRHSRPLLRRTSAGLLPDEVRMRPHKTNFDALFHEALAGPDLLAARALLGHGARLGEYVALDKVERELLSGAPSTRRARQDWAIKLWRLVTAECWLRAVEDPGAPRAAVEGLLAEPHYSFEATGRPL